MHPDARSRFSNLINEAEAEKKNFDFEYKIIVGNTGSERWVHGSGGFEYGDAPDTDYLICTIQDVTDRRIKEEENYYLSYHDQLTGLYNRRFFEEELLRLDTARNLPLTVIMGDVNGLKLINDSFGHDAGDELLRKSANVIKKCCRADDIIARTGGDEFVMVMPKLDSGEAKAITKRIKGYAEKESIENISISISLGFETKRDPEEPIHEVLKRAEDYMYKKKLFENQSLRGKTISSIIATLHEKNKREELHSNRVSVLCESMGAALGLPDYQVMELKTVGLFHDIGKIAIDEDILSKKEKLTAEEWEEVKRHSEIGYRILSTANEMSEMAGYVLAHHERWDGNGYPRGLKGSEIPLESRIISIADAYDAMTSESCYQDIVSEEEAVKILKKGAGVKFDPALVDVFIEKVLGRAS
jgi:diguanylate cyclase (GGDEF)-like protein